MEILEKKQLLLEHIEKLHTTKLGVERIKKNLSIEIEDIASWCRAFIVMEDAVIEKRGKNWYIYRDQMELTVNAYSYTIITAHKKKK